MNKSKISMAKISNYLREISVVVIGVAITLSVSVWINNRNEKRNLVLYLNALKLELEGNAESFDDYAKWLQKSVRYANYIRSNDEKSLNQDTIAFYRQSDNSGCGWGNIQSNTIVITNAFEMFKTSGAMLQVEDKKLLMFIWGVYSEMENVQSFLDMCFQRKNEESTKEWYLKADGKPVAVPMQFFYSSSLPYAMVRNCEQVSEMIRETISKLEESKILK